MQRDSVERCNFPVANAVTTSFCGIGTCVASSALNSAVRRVDNGFGSNTISCFVGSLAIFFVALLVLLISVVVMLRLATWPTTRELWGLRLRRY